MFLLFLAVSPLAQMFLEVIENHILILSDYFRRLHVAENEDGQEKIKEPPSGDWRKPKKMAMFLVSKKLFVLATTLALSDLFLYYRFLAHHF